MTVERGLRLVAGSFVLLSLALGLWVSPYWLLFTGFVAMVAIAGGLAFGLGGQGSAADILKKLREDLQSRK